MLDNLDEIFGRSDEAAESQRIVTDGGEPVDDENPNDTGRAARSSNLTGRVADTLESQSEREQTARETINNWESNASEETQRIIDEYNELASDVGSATEWQHSLDTLAGDLVDDLEYGSDLRVSDYAETTSEQVEGLTGTIRRFANMIDDKEEEISEKRDELDNLEDQKEDDYDAIDDQIEGMDSDDLPVGTSWNEFRDSERDQVDWEYDQKESELEKVIADLQADKESMMDRKQSSTSERTTRREEAQEVYNEFAGGAESVVEENYNGLRDSLRVLRDLEVQQETYEEESVDEGVINQRQEDQAEARTEAALAYASEALERIEQIENAVSDHQSVRDNFSDAVNVDTRDLEPIYNDLVEADSVDADVDEDENYGTEVLRQRVLEASEAITDDGYDSVRELRDIADNIADDY